MPNQDRPQDRSQPNELPDLTEADRANGERTDADQEASDGLSTPSMQSEEERAGVTPPPQTAAEEMD